MNQTSKLSVAMELIEKRIAECSIKLHETKKWVFINNTAPSPNEIALAAYGTEQEKG